MPTAAALVLTARAPVAGSKLQVTLRPLFTPLFPQEPESVESVAATETSEAGIGKE